MVELVFCAVAWTRERCLPSTSHHLLQVGDLAMGPRKQETWYCPLPATALRRLGSVPHLGYTVELILVAESWMSWHECMTMGELALQLARCVAA